MKYKEKVVQTTLSPEEHAILVDYATRSRSDYLQNRLANFSSLSILVVS